MKIGKPLGLLLSLIIVVISGFALLLSGIWYLAIISGILAAVIIRKGYAISISSGFIGGLIISMLFLILLPLNDLSPVLSEVASLSGISASVLLLLMLVVTSLLCLSGALIGTFASSLFKKVD